MCWLKAVGHTHTKNLGQTIKLLKSKFHSPLEPNMSLKCLKDTKSNQYRWVVLPIPIYNRNCGVLPSWGIILSPLETVSLQPSSPSTASQCWYSWFLSKEMGFLQKALRCTGTVRNKIQTRVILKWVGDIIEQACFYHNLDDFSGATIATKRCWHVVK